MFPVVGASVRFLWVCAGHGGTGPGRSAAPAPRCRDVSLI